MLSTSAAAGEEMVGSGGSTGASTGWRRRAEVVLSSLFLLSVTAGFLILGARGRLPKLLLVSLATLGQS